MNANHEFKFCHLISMRIESFLLSLRLLKEFLVFFILFLFVSQDFLLLKIGLRLRLRANETKSYIFFEIILYPLLSSSQNPFTPQTFGTRNLMIFLFVR